MMRENPPPVRTTAPHRCTGSRRRTRHREPREHATPCSPDPYGHPDRWRDSTSRIPAAPARLARGRVELSAHLPFPLRLSSSALSFLVLSSTTLAPSDTTTHPF